MRSPAALVLAALAATIPLAGCLGSADAEDPLAYLRKPLYASTFHLSELGEDGTDFQEFRVTDGSIVEIRLQVWINATAGAATVKITNPSGHVVFEGTQTGEVLAFVELGVWRVDVTGSGEGEVGILATRN